MKCSRAALVLAATCVLAVCYVQRSEGYQFQRLAKVYKGQCLLQSGYIIPFEGVLYDNKRCETVSCYERRGKMYESVTGCGVVAAPEDCQIIQGIGQYPDCCPQVQC